MPYVTSKDGTRIAYESVGSGPVVVLVDGAMAHREHRGGRPLAAALSNQFTVVCYDRRGRGESGDTSPYAAEREIEDIDALIQAAGAPVRLYGFSSGAVLALHAAAALRGKVAKLAVLEPPFNGDDDASKREMAEFGSQLTALVRENRRGDAVEFFLGGMVPPDVLEGMKQMPEWKLMEAVAPTLAYEVVLMGDGAVPLNVAAAVTIPTLVLVGGESPPFKQEAVVALARALPEGRRETLHGQTTLVAPEVIAPILSAFFR